jgi:hypothetical protein
MFNKSYADNYYLHTYFTYLGILLGPQTNLGGFSESLSNTKFFTIQVDIAFTSIQIHKDRLSSKPHTVPH